AGRSAEDNEVVREGGTKPDLGAGAQPHWELIKKYDIIDFDLGARCGLHRGAAAHLGQRGQRLR
nr:hypothetical protein [Tanacetum cinerariifolium]